MDNDASSHLRLNKLWNDSGVVSEMIKIQEWKESKDSLRHWRDDLKLLFREHREYRVLDHWLPDPSEPDGGYVDYVALSYTWATSLYEDPAQYSWRIGDGVRQQRSNVRDAVMDRVVSFMDHLDIQHLWIDAECMEQEDQEIRRRLMDAMHLVYRNSYRPLALLFVPIRTSTELALLERLLRGTMIQSVSRKRHLDHHCENHVLSNDVSLNMALSILDLLHRIVSDEWWSRAWCFQEEYVTMKKLTLFLPSFIDLTCRKQRRFISFINGNIGINAWEFRVSATRFIFAYVAKVKNTPDWTLDKGLCRHILQRAGWYRLMAVYGDTIDLDNKGKAMTTQILTDISSKSFTVPSDLIHISSNCNVYSTTLNTAKLEVSRKSLAMSLLTLFFINGEIFKNGIGEGPSTRESGDLNTFQYLKCIAFDDFPATGGPGYLANLRKHRFVKPHLTDFGVKCVGHLWRIDQMLDVSLDSSTESSLSTDESESDATNETIEMLNNMCIELVDRFDFLATELGHFVNHDYSPSTLGKPVHSFDTKSFNAAELAGALRAGKFLGIGHIVLNAGDNDQVDDGQPIKRGLFAIDSFVSKENPIHAFTAWQAGQNTDKWYEGQLREDRYVSLRVSIDEDTNDIKIPSLRTESKIESLCFWKGIKQTSVVFPWPRSLLPGTVEWFTVYKHIKDA